MRKSALYGKAHSGRGPSRKSALYATARLQNAHFGEAHTQNAPFREGDTPRVRLYVSRRLRPHVSPQQRNSVHKCPETAPRGPILPFVYTVAIPGPPTTQAHDPTVYTNAPKRHREAILANLCTLLCRHPGGEAHVAGAVTQPPTHTNSRSLSLWVASLGARSKTSPILSVWPASPHRRNRPLSLRP